MDDQRTDRKGGEHNGSNLWLTVICIIGLALAAFKYGIHALQGGSYRPAVWAILNIVCIYLLGSNVPRSLRKE